MKKIAISTLVASSILSFGSANAVNLSLNKNNLRLNSQASSLAVQATLDDNIDSLTGTGTIKARVKVKSKNISLSSKTITIPYQDGVIGSSEDLTLSLINTDLTESSTAKLKIKFPKKFRKKFKLKNFSDEITIDATTPKVSGRITIPSGDVTSFRTRTRAKLARLRAKGINPLNTENPDGILVELIEISPETGEQVGEALATAVTDTNGEYEIELPEDVKFGSNHALLVEGDNEEEMHAPLFSDEVDINPGSEVIFDLTQEAIQSPEQIGLEPTDDINFENFTDLEAETLDEQLEELNPIYEKTLAESLVNIRESYEEFLNNMLGFAADEDTLAEDTNLETVAKGIAGDYNVVFFDSRLTSEDRVDISVQLTSGRMSKPNEVGSLIVKPGAGFQTSARSFPNGNSQSPDQGNNDGGQGAEGEDDNSDNGSNNDKFGCYDIESESGTSETRNADAENNFYMTVDKNKIISFAEPAFEESIENPDGTYIFRSKPGVMNMIPVGDNMFLSSSLSVGENISPLDEVEKEYTTGFGSIIKKADLEDGSIIGDYGLVGLGYTTGSESRGAISFVGDLTFAGNTVNYNLASTEIKQNNFNCDGSNYAIEVEDGDTQGTGNLKYNGDRVTINLNDQEDGTSSLFTGFSTDDKEILTMAFAADFGNKGSRGDSNLISNAERQMIFAVKKPSSLVNLAGKNYRLISLNFSFNDQGGRSIAAGEVGAMTFASSTVSVSDFTKTVYDKTSFSAESVTESSSVSSNSGLAYSLSETGSISFNMGDEELTGYVSSDARLIILNSDKEQELGTYLAVLQN